MSTACKIPGCAETVLNRGLCSRTGGHYWTHRGRADEELVPAVELELEELGDGEPE